MNQHRYAVRDDLDATPVAATPMPVRPYEVRVARSLKEIVALGTPWRMLERKCDGAGFFQTYDWCRYAAEHDVVHGEQDFAVFTVFQGDDLVAILPLRLQAKKLRTVLSGLAEPFQQYTEMLMAEGHDAKRIFAPIKAALGDFGADYLHLGQVRNDGPLFAAIDGDIPPTGESKGAPNVALQQWPDFDNYFKSLNAKSRKNLRNLRNKLARKGEIGHHVAFGGPLLDTVIDRTFEGRSAWLDTMGLTSRAFRNAGFEEFVSGFKSGGSTGVTTVAMSMTLDGHPIAEQWGFVHQRRYYAFISTWDVDYQEFSPGRLHLEEVVRACSALDIAVVDFMVPSVAYKLNFATEETPVNDYILPLTPIGRLYGGVWMNHLRPLAKSLAYAVPAGVRKSVFSKLPGQAAD